MMPATEAGIMACPAGVHRGGRKGKGLFYGTEGVVCDNVPAERVPLVTLREM
jgi:hypothetical protein